MVMKLGTTIDALPRDGIRDAHHVASALATSWEALLPGESVGFLDATTVRKAAREMRHGIVDPFLSDPVGPGVVFWVLVDPKHVTEIRHAFEIAGVTGAAQYEADYDGDSWCREAGCD
jgi:hypothetical protein